MPVVSASRDGRCAACGQRVLAGELIEYELQAGPRHLACTDKAPERRRNAYRARCVRCGRRLGVGRGVLSVVEERAGEAYSRRWVVACVDVEACARACAR